MEQELTLEYVATRVAEIIRNDDPENAHGSDDQLRQIFIEAVMKNKINPDHIRPIALELLKTNTIERWYG